MIDFDFNLLLLLHLCLLESVGLHLHDDGHWALVRACTEVADPRVAEQDGRAEPASGHGAARHGPRRSRPRGRWRGAGRPSAITNTSNSDRETASAAKSRRAGAGAPTRSAGWAANSRRCTIALLVVIG